MSVSKGKFLQFAGGLSLSGALLLWIGFNVEWSEVLTELRKMNYLVLLPCTAGILLHYYLRALRWRYLLPKKEPLPTRSLFNGIMIGNLATYVLPLRAGEFIRPYALTRYAPSYKFSTNFVSVVIERFFDLSAVLATFALMVQYIEGLDPRIYQGAWALSILAIGISLFILGATLVPSVITKLFTRILKWFPSALSLKIKEILDNVLEGTSVLKDGRSLSLIILTTLLIWVSNYFIYWGFIFLLPDVQPNLWLGVSIAVIIALSVALPSAPGFVGVYQVACVIAFGLFGVDKESATAYGLVTHLLQFVFVVIVGIHALFSSNLSLSALKAGTEREQKDAAPNKEGTSKSLSGR